MPMSRLKIQATAVISTTAPTMTASCSGLRRNAQADDERAGHGRWVRTADGVQHERGGRDGEGDRADPGRGEPVVARCGRVHQAEGGEAAVADEYSVRMTEHGVLGTGLGSQRCLEAQQDGGRQAGKHPRLVGGPGQSSRGARSIHSRRVLTSPAPSAPRRAYHRLSRSRLPHPFIRPARSAA